MCLNPNWIKIYDINHKLFWQVYFSILEEIVGELIYTCKMIQSGIFSRFSQPVHFSRFKPDNLLLSTSSFSGYNLEKYTGLLNLEINAMLDHFTDIYQFPNCVCLTRQSCFSSSLYWGRTFNNIYHIDFHNCFNLWDHMEGKGYSDWML